MTYHLVKGSEVNCLVYLEEEGLLDVVPLNPFMTYRFLYKEIDRNGKEAVRLWSSETELSGSGLSRLPEDIEISKKKPDSNHGSTFKF